MTYRRVLSWTVACWLVAGTAQAGPIELFNGMFVQVGQPDHYALTYQWGNGGMFFTANGGKDYALLCTHAIDPELDHATDNIYVIGQNGIFVADTSGVWRGDLNGCGWKSMDDLKGQWIGALAIDPIDPTITYATTAGGASMNSIYMNDGKSDKWTSISPMRPEFLNTLHVVKKDSGRRFIMTAVRSGTTPQYFISISDDGGKTWTDNLLDPIDKFGTPDTAAELRVAAIDPTNPDHIVAVVDRGLDRDENMTVDDLIYSTNQGKTDTWSLIGHVTTSKALLFKPDGSLVYGDEDQDTPGLFVVDKLGNAPRQLSNNWQVNCLQYDSKDDRMYGCHQWQFGTVDMNSGAFTLGFDMRAASHFVDCPGEAPVADRCSDQLLAAYCGQGHYPQAPLCGGYNRTWYDPAQNATDPSTCGCVAGTSGGLAGMSGGAGVSGDAGMSGAGAGGDSSAAGSGGSSAGMGGAAGSGNAGHAAAAGSGAHPAKKSSGCGVTGVASNNVGAGALWSVALWLGVGRLRRRARKSA